MAVLLRQDDAGGDEADRRDHGRQRPAHGGRNEQIEEQRDERRQRDDRGR